MKVVQFSVADPNMGQAASKLGTGLKSTGGSFRREGVQAYPVLIYTKLLKGPKSWRDMIDVKYCDRTRKSRKPIDY